MTLSSGVLEIGAEWVTVHLMPKVNYSPQLRRVIGQVLDQINREGLEWPDGTARKLRYRLGHRSELQVTMRPGSGADEAPR